MTLFVLRHRVGRVSAVAGAAVLAVGMIVAGVMIMHGGAHGQRCSLTVRGFPTVYGDAAVHEVIWLDQSSHRAATMDVVDTPGVAGSSTITLPCGDYTFRAPPAPAASAAEAIPIRLHLRHDETIILGRSPTGAAPSRPTVP